MFIRMLISWPFYGALAYLEVQIYRNPVVSCLSLLFVSHISTLTWLAHFLTIRPLKIDDLIHQGSTVGHSGAFQLGELDSLRKSFLVCKTCLILPEFGMFGRKEALRNDCPLGWHFFVCVCVLPKRVSMGFLILICESVVPLLDIINISCPSEPDSERILILQNRPRNPILRAESGCLVRMALVRTFPEKMVRTWQMN